MRYNINKGESSKAERIIYEILKELRVPFRHRWLIGNKEIDFIVNNVAIEINGHTQDESRNRLIVELGYTPIHFSNQYIKDNRLELKNIITKLIYGKCKLTTKQHKI